MKYFDYTHFVLEETHTKLKRTMYIKGLILYDVDNDYKTLISGLYFGISINI